MGNLYVSAALAAAPVAILIYLMVKRNPWPSYTALPLSALLMYLLKLIYFSSPANTVNATVLSGLLTALTPILIIWGAILLFKIMEASGCMDTVRAWLNGITPNPVAQLMLIGWAFSFMIEGASGFGTPAALAAPLLVGLGFDPVKTAILCLIMNSVPVSFGAVGTPTWFGFGTLGLDSAQIAQIGWKSAIMHSVAALVVPVLALRFVVGWQAIRENLGYIYLSILVCIIPYVLIAFYSYEFPSLAAGFIGFIASVWFARRGIGLKHDPQAAIEHAKLPQHSVAELTVALFPLWGSVLVLVLTRVKQLGIKGILNDAAPFFTQQLGTLGDFSVSPGLVLNLNQIFGSATNWSFKLLYIPAIIPFLVVSILTALLCRMSLRKTVSTGLDACRMMRLPAISLGGALILVGLLMEGGKGACSQMMGQALANLAGSAWFIGAPYLGALGAFFAGSNTVSNLTFGGIQLSVAQALNLDTTTILALQSVGGAMGNMVCINNIVAVGSVLGLTATAGFEGYVLKRTIWPMLLYGLLALLAALAL